MNRFDYSRAYLDSAILILTNHFEHFELIPICGTTVCSFYPAAYSFVPHRCIAFIDE